MQDRSGDRAMLKRFIIAFVTFVAIVIPGTLGVALLAASAYPAPAKAAGCEQAIGSIAGASARGAVCR
jgi:hypothetical protein